MTASRILGLAIVGAALIVAVLLMRAVLDQVPAPGLTPATGAPASAPASAEPSPTPPSSSVAPSPGAIATASAATTTDPRLGYAAFVERLDDARRETAPLLDDLREAADAFDEAGVRSAAEALGAIADRERRWLAANPPAPCYADAHAEADGTYAATATAADAAIAWADAAGLAKLGALVSALDAVGVATDAVEGLAATLGRVDCG